MSRVRGADSQAGGGLPVCPPARVRGAVPRGWLRLTLLLSAPAAWFVLIYLRRAGRSCSSRRSGAWTRSPASSSTTGTSTTSGRSSSDPTYRTIALRTIGIAAAVTVTDALLALPFAYFAARLAPRAAADGAVRDRARAAVDELPRARLRVAADPRQGRDPQLDAGQARASARVDIAYSNWAMWIVFSYIWLPFMILPVWVAFERVPDSLPRGLAPTSARAAGRRSAACMLPLVLPGRRRPARSSPSR